MDDKVKDYILDVVFATREPERYGLNELKDSIEYGASPRATIFLNLAARAHAFLRHRGFVTPEDVKAVGIDVLRHRVIAHLRGRGRGAHPGADRPAGLRPGRGARRGRRCCPGSSSSASASWRSPPAQVVNDAAGGPVPLGLQGPGDGVLRGAPVPAGRRHPHHRLERHRAHERRLREGVHRGARADGDAAGRRLGLRGVRLARHRASRRWPPRWRRRSPSPPSPTTTGWA